MSFSYEVSRRLSLTISTIQRRLVAQLENEVANLRSWFSVRGRRGRSVMSVVAFAVSLAVVTTTGLTSTGAQTLLPSDVQQVWSPAASLGTGTGVGAATFSLSCPTTTFCMATTILNAGGDGYAEEWLNGQWLAPMELNDSYESLSAPTAQISCGSPTSCVIVTEVGQSIVWNGTSWSTPSQIETGSITAISCASSTFCVAVDPRGYALQWNGSTWSSRRPSTTALDAVSCPTSTFCEAVTPNGYLTTWNGTSWSALSQLDATAAAGVSTVSCANSSFCLAIWYSTTVYNGNDYLSWNGSIWTSIPSPTPDVTSGVPELYVTLGPQSVSCVAGNTCILMGDDTASLGADGIYPEADVTWNGTSWSTLNVSVATGDNQVWSLSCASANFCAAAAPNGGAMQLVGGNWTAAAGDFTTWVNGLSCTPSGFCMAVDAIGAHLWSGTAWQVGLYPPGGAAGYTAVSCVSSTFCVVVDGAGWADIWNGTQWHPYQAEPSVPGTNLTAVNCSSTSFCVAFGSDGSAVTWNGSTWSAPVTTGLAGTPSSVSCPASNFCTAVDNEGYDVQWNGSTWSGASQLFVGQGNFGAGSPTFVSCPSASFCQAVNSNGEAASWGGSTWSAPVPIDNIDQTSLAMSVSCVSPTFCEAIVNLGEISTWNGSSWSAPVTVDPNATSFGLNPANITGFVSCTSTSQCLFVDYESSGASYEQLVPGDSTTTTTTTMPPTTTTTTLPTTTTTLTTTTTTLPTTATTLPTTTTTLKPLPPRAPSIRVSSISNGVLSVSLKGTVVNGGSRITRYQYSLGGKSWINISKNSHGVFVIGHLTSGKTYSVRLRAMNAFGFGVASKAVNARVN